MEIKFAFAIVYRMSSQVSQDYNSWVQLACFILRGCELSHNSMKTCLLGLYDPALLNERRQSLTNPFEAVHLYFALLFDERGSCVFVLVAPTEGSPLNVA